MWSVRALGWKKYKPDETSIRRGRAATAAPPLRRCEFGSVPGAYLWHVACSIRLRRGRRRSSMRNASRIVPGALMAAAIMGAACSPAPNDRTTTTARPGTSPQTAERARPAMVRVVHAIPGGDAVDVLADDA